MLKDALSRQNHELIIPPGQKHCHAAPSRNVLSHFWDDFFMRCAIAPSCGGVTSKKKVQCLQPWPPASHGCGSCASVCAAGRVASNNLASSLALSAGAMWWLDATRQPLSTCLIMDLLKG